MKRIAMVTAVVLTAWGAWLWAQEVPRDLDDLRRETLSAEDLRFRRTVELARMLDSAGHLKEARKLYEEALVMRPDDKDVPEALLLVLRKLGDHEAQLPLLERLMAGRPGDPGLRMQLAGCLWGCKRTSEARATWNDLLNRFPGSVEVYSSVIDFTLAEGLFEDAREVIRRRRGRFGEDARLLLVEADLALAEKKTPEALSLLLRSLELDPTDDEEGPRAEHLLLVVAHQSRPASGGDDLVRDLNARIDALDAELAERLLRRADESTEGQDYAQAVAFARRALLYLKDPARCAEISARITLWQTKTPK